MPTETLTTTARIIEVFSSIQGEGLCVGQPHLFVRFWDCNLKCRYCDTDYRGPYTEMTRAQLEGRVSQLLVEQGPHEAVSLTGGEPLLWRQFLTGFLPWLKTMGQRTYLETNGTLPKALADVLEWVDVIAMDVKPPSSTEDRAVWDEHAEFLRVARRAVAPPALFVKIVVTPQTTEADLDQAAALVADADRTIPLVLQPVTPVQRFLSPQGGTARVPPWAPSLRGQQLSEPSLFCGAEQLQRWLRLARARLDDVRVIPQIHPILGVR